MFNLQTGIHFHKPEPRWGKGAAAISDKFNCACPFIVDCFCCIYSGTCHRGAHFIRHMWGGGFFDYLLMSSLHRTIPFKQMQMCAMTVGEQLHLNMTWGSNIFFNNDMAVPKGGYSLPHRTVQKRSKSIWAINFSHALTAATRSGFY